MNEPLELKVITKDEEQERFADACEHLLGIEVGEFVARLDKQDFSGLDRSAAMRVAMLRPA